ncbi:MULTISPECIES: isochorismatase family cysteine hydrolase [unclassified Fusibacter]|uniref:isochorismatase family cysteine hydrolase n=1 Tax=unclassified Fusibacter TaxID=2624464 RepID=UPI00101384F7|nr:MULTISPECIES: isochorismatase family cysteine hydrolase [unclassified Fusibacter]MCK8060590.1 cysteine hydrolase [Fusibacter sp. A2]NPE22956.1 cysteine hydrolase [Fusibacter sp. A1]RXV60022.1 cysteine hydrolase [Fusibacter sp. A1]
MSKSIEAFERIRSSYEALEKIDLSQFSKDDTVLLITDMINGFAHFGALSSPRVLAIAQPIAEFAKLCEEKQIEILAFADAHTEKSPEFGSYPTHCLKGTEESEIVPEIATAVSFKRIDKNSTNAYLEPEFQKLLEGNPKWKNFIVVGDCTDICINQLAITLKTHFNRLDEKVNVIVPVDLVDTYDYDLHEGDLLHIMGLYMMEQNGVQLVKWG